MPRAAMIELDYAALTTAPVAIDPFPHVVVSGFLPPASLDAVLADLPALGKRGSFPVDSVRLGPNAAALMEGMEGPVLRAAIERLFGLDLSGSPTMVTLRGWTGDRDGRIHCESLAKRVTVLLYLNRQTDAWSRQEGCLRLLRGPRDLEDFAVEVPPVNGTLLVFPNGPTTWHGHKSFSGQRYVVQLNYMTNDGAARSEIRRHKVSAFFKGFARV
jgi:hypothetical protein